MYYKIEDFLNDWDYESSATLKNFELLTDKSLDTKVYNEGRTLGYIAWHITYSIGEMMNRTGLQVKSPDEKSDAPASAKEISTKYMEASKSLIDEIKNKWNDESLRIEDDMYGQKWKRYETLSRLVSHQTHHRGQMSVLMRQAGLKVHGVYGPAKEEWEKIGMTPMK